MEQKLHPQNHPDTLTHSQFIFEPLHPKHVHLDFQAVMNTANFLQKWSFSAWPWENFSVEENLKDLEWHDSDHQNGTAFTYTILNPARDLCLGCIYINPTTRITPVTPEEGKLLESVSAVCTYWVEASLQKSLEDIVFSTLKTWIDTQWSFPNLVFANNPQTPQQSQIFRTHGLQLWLQLTNPTRYQNLWK